MKTPAVTVTSRGRAFAVYVGAELLAVTVYRRGALAVAERIAGPAGFADETPAGLRSARTQARRPRPTLAPNVHPAPNLYGVAA